MKIRASACRGRGRDLKTYCQSLSLGAQTEEEARWLVALYAVVKGESDGLPCLPGTHRWVVKPLGGPPDAADSTERVKFCEACGWEYTEG